MQAMLVLLAVAGSTAWLAVDASKRDWTDNSFGRNVPSWVIGSLLLWPLVFPMYVFAHRKKAPLKGEPKAKPSLVAAMEASHPAEQYGPSLDEVAEPQPEPVVEIEPEPVVEIEPEPVVHVEPEPVVEPAPAPAFESVLTPEPDPVLELESAEPAVATADTVVETAEPLVESAEPVAEVEVAEPAPEPAPEPEPTPLLEISYPETPAEEAPPGLSVDAFKDIKPVAFGGAAVGDEPAPVAEPTPEPVAEPEPYPVAEQPAVEREPEPVPAFEPLSYPLDSEPVIEREPELEPEPVMAAMEGTSVAEETAVADAKPKKRGFRIPNPGLKLPSTGLKLPQITLPENLQGPLSDLERKIVLGAAVAIVAAAALGYSTAPADEPAPAPTPAPAAASR